MRLFNDIFGGHPVLKSQKDEPLARTNSVTVPQILDKIWQIRLKIDSFIGCVQRLWGNVWDI